MESAKISETFSDLTEDIRRYINLRIDLVKLTLTEKLARMASFFLITLVFFILFMFFILFLSLAFVFWWGDEIGPVYMGALIITAVYALAGFIIYLFRNQLFLNPLVSQITRILMEEKDEQEEQI